MVASAASAAAHPGTLGGSARCAGAGAPPRLPTVCCPAGFSKRSMPSINNVPPPASMSSSRAVASHPSWALSAARPPPGMRLGATTTMRDSAWTSCASAFRTPDLPASPTPPRFRRRARAKALKSVLQRIGGKSCADQLFLSGITISPRRILPPRWPRSLASGNGPSSGLCGR